MGFYEELFTSGGSCIGCGNGRDYDRWLKEMQNRHAGRSVQLQIRADGIPAELRRPCGICCGDPPSGAYSCKGSRI